MDLRFPQVVLITDQGSWMWAVCDPKMVGDNQAWPRRLKPGLGHYQHSTALLLQGTGRRGLYRRRSGFIMSYRLAAPMPYRTCNHTGPAYYTRDCHRVATAAGSGSTVWCRHTRTAIDFAGNAAQRNQLIADFCTACWCDRAVGHWLARHVIASVDVTGRNLGLSKAVYSHWGIRSK